VTGKELPALTREHVWIGQDLIDIPIEHEPTSIETVSRIIIRDSSGRARVVDPSDNKDIDTKGARNTAIGTHAALTTGVHGAGALYVAKTRLASQFTLFSPDLLTDILPPISIDGFTTSVTAGGSIVARAWDFHIETPNVANDDCGMYCTGGYVSPFESDKLFTIEFPYNYNGGTNPRTNVERYMYFINKNTYPLETTFNHIGFTIKNRRVWASSADGTNRTETDTTHDSTDGQYPGEVYKIVCDPGVDVKFYVNEVLIATHTLAGHHIPLTTTAWGVVTLGQKTLANEKKQCSWRRVLVYKEL